MGNETLFSSSRPPYLCFYFLILILYNPGKFFKDLIPGSLVSLSNYAFGDQAVGDRTLLRPYGPSFGALIGAPRLPAISSDRA